jgi:3',5'-cyclic AMP phosphodiesterase CpdA
MNWIRHCCFAAPLLIVLSTPALSNAHEGAHGPRQVKPDEYYAPSPMPDRIVLTWCDDPTTTQAVTWRTSKDVKEAYAEIAVATPDPNYDQNAGRILADTQPLKTNINEAHFHTVRFTDLEPGTKYIYRVGDGVNWSEWFQFTTAREDEQTFSFIYFGDAQNDIRSKWSRVIREAYRDAPKAAFMLHAGDLVNRAESDAEWGEWFGAGKWLNAMMPSIAIPGNHEQARDARGNRKLSHHWRPTFEFPTNGPEGFEETCYTLVYGNTRIIGMNSTQDYDIQAAWLDRVLAENESLWTVVTFHHPVFSTGQNRDNERLRTAWKPVLDKYNVDLVLQGHDHTYGRTGLTTPDDLPKTIGNVPTGINKIDEHTGTVYVVSVSGPKQYSLSKKPFMVRGAANTQLYQIIHIDDDQLTFEARTATGELYDKFELVKRPGQTNQIIEGEGLMEERLANPPGRN